MRNTHYKEHNVVERIKLLAKRKTLVLYTQDYFLLGNSIERKLPKAENCQERLPCKERIHTRQNCDEKDTVIMGKRIDLLAKRKTLVLRTQDYSLLGNSIERKLSKAGNCQGRLPCKERTYTRQNHDNFSYNI